LLYSSDDDDDDDDTFKFDADLEDFPLEDYADPNKEAKLPGKRRPRYDDGPQPRDYSKMTPTERSDAEAEDTKKRRVWLAKQRRERMLNESAHVVNFTGIVHASLRTMHDVEQGTRLQLGQTFPSSNIIMLCCAEEANLRGIYVTTLKSDKFTFKIEGLHFRVHASNSEVRGWKITLCETSVGVAGTHTRSCHLTLTSVQHNLQYWTQYWTWHSPRNNHREKSQRRSWCRVVLPIKHQKVVVT